MLPNVNICDDISWILYLVICIYFIILLLLLLVLVLLICNNVALVNPWLVIIVELGYYRYALNPILILIWNI